MRHACLICFDPWKMFAQSPDAIAVPSDTNPHKEFPPCAMPA